MTRDPRHVFTRRQFLATSAIATLGMTLPGFLTRSVAMAQPSPGAAPAFRDDRILVVIQLGGGNDGLNTVVPHADDAYHKARGVIAKSPDSLLKLDDHLGLNGRMTAMKELYDNGELAIVNGVGYPNPNRSHFRSMEIWHTAVDSDRVADTGWIGRYFDNCCSGRPHPASAVNLGGDLPQAFGGRSGVGIAFNEPADFSWVNADGGSRGAFDRLNDVSGHYDPEGGTLDFLRHTTANAVLSSDRVIRAASAPRRMVEYPGGRLAPSLRTIASLIAGGLPTRIYYASLGGFDTHANQAGLHDSLLAQFSGALAAFLRDLKNIGLADRVTVMAFSEFGRRVVPNASRGTDHGTAGPMFLAGAGINPGLHSPYPSLEDLQGGDLKHTVDFRSVYGEVLTSWLGADHAAALGRTFPSIGVIKA